MRCWAVTSLIWISGMMTYFKRLKDFISKAQDRNIIVDIAFFNGMYPDRWEYQAMYHTNNIQGDRKLCIQ